VKNDGKIDKNIVKDTLDLLEIGSYGLDKTDQKIIETIIEKFSDGPVGLDTLSASISEDIDTISDVYEPYLMQIGFLERTPRGRKVTNRAKKHYANTKNKKTI
jgi:Holliday junction DNA helicase RuvB